MRDQLKARIIREPLYMRIRDKYYRLICNNSINSSTGKSGRFELQHWNKSTLKDDYPEKHQDMFKRFDTSVDFDETERNLNTFYFSDFKKITKKDLLVLSQRPYFILVEEDKFFKHYGVEIIFREFEI